MGFVEREDALLTDAVLAAEDPVTKTTETPERTWYVEVRLGQATTADSEAQALEIFRDKFLKLVPKGGFMEREYVKFSVSSDPFMD